MPFRGWDWLLRVRRRDWSRGHSGSSCCLISRLLISWGKVMVDQSLLLQNQRPEGAKIGEDRWKEQEVFSRDDP